MQLTEGQMPPSTRSFGEGEQAYTEVYQHLAGVQTDLVKQVADIVAIRKQTRKRATLREAYIEAMDEFMSDIRRGENIEILATAKVGRDVHFWLREDLAEDFDETCKKLNCRKNVVFATAIRRWLERQRKL